MACETANLGSLAIVFPGQGAQDAGMLDGVKSLPAFRHRYDIACEFAGRDILAVLAGDDHAVVNQNLLSSLMTLLVNTLLFDRFTERGVALPNYLAGYSIGQWSALYASKMLDYDTIIRLITARARLMDECVAQEPSAMCAVIGIGERQITELVEEVNASGFRAYISNFNCPGQYSISGTLKAIALFETKAKELLPKKLLVLPVSGGWHCPIVEKAARSFRILLDVVQFKAPEFPIVDNVTGDWLSTEPDRLRESLSLHIYSPVQWERTIRKLIAAGCTRFVEVGYGNMLTKFGFFIDRDVDHEAFGRREPSTGARLPGARV